MFFWVRRKKILKNKNKIDYINKELKNKYSKSTPFFIKNDTMALKIGYLFSDSFPHAVFYTTTRKQDSIILSIFSKRDKNWNFVYQTNTVRLVPAPLYDEFIFTKERNPDIIDLKVLKIYGQIHNIQIFTYFRYIPKKDTFEIVKNYEKIASPKYDTIKNEIQSFMNKGCADALKEYKIYKWKNDNIVLLKKYDIDCCQKKGNCDVIISDTSNNKQKLVIKSDEILNKKFLLK